MDLWLSLDVTGIHLPFIEILQFAFLMPSFLCAAARCPTAEVPCVCWVMWHSIGFFGFWAIPCNDLFWQRSDLTSLKNQASRRCHEKLKQVKQVHIMPQKMTKILKPFGSLLIYVYKFIIVRAEIVSMPQDTSCLLQGVQLVLWKLLWIQSEVKEYEQGIARCCVPDGLHHFWSLSNLHTEICLFHGILVGSAQSKGAATSESERAVVFARACCSDRVFRCSRQELCCSQDCISNTLKLWAAATENDSNISSW